MTSHAELYIALSTDPNILNFVGGDTTKITNSFPDDDLFGDKFKASNFPRITFILEDRRPVFYTDDNPVLDEIQFTIDIFLPTSLFGQYTLNEIRYEIDRVLLALGYYKVTESERRMAEDRVANMTITYGKSFQSNL